MKIGDEIAGKYKILDILGQGGSATVYLAQDNNIGNMWAIKKVSKSGCVKNPMDEALMLGKLNHPALPRVFDVIDTELNTFIVMEYLEGETPDKIVREDELTDESRLLQWAKELCRVMIYLHNHKSGTIIYRDLKPQNILIMKDGTVRLVDFGIARDYDKKASNDTVYIGTNGFAAPEQYGSGQSDKRTDIYGFGMTINCLIKKSLPGDKDIGKKFSEKDDLHVSPFLKKIVAKCMANDPEQRYQMFEDVLEDLDRLDKVKYVNSNDYKLNNNTKERMIITVWDNPEFACEFAYFTSAFIDGEVLLVDFNLLDPRIDIHMGTKMYIEKSMAGVPLSGVDVLMENLYKGNINKESLSDACVKAGSKDNLFIVTGNFNMNNYEYFSNECLVKFLDKCLKYFDEVIINVNKFIYDSYTLFCLIASDLNIYAGKTDIASLRTLNSQISFLEQKQRIPSKKFKVVSWCEASAGLLPVPLLYELTESRFIGHVTENKKRISLSNDKKCFSKVAGPVTAKEYFSLLKKIGVIKANFKTGKRYVNR